MYCRNHVTNFQSDSESLVAGAMFVSVYDINIDKQGYGLGSVEGLFYDEEERICYDGDINNVNYYSYISQIGLQGVVYAEIAKLYGSLECISIFRFINCACLAIVISLISFFIWNKNRKLFAIVFAIVSFKAKWPNFFATNMYWVEFVWFIPMLLGAIRINCKKRHTFLYLLYFVSIAVKSLCGYEYLSTIMMSGLAFIIVEWIGEKDKRSELTKEVVLISISMLMGFVCVYIYISCIHIWKW